MQTITSAQNDTIKHYATLLRGKGRKQTGLMLLEGEKLIGEALSANIAMEAVLVDLDALERYANLLAQLEGVEQYGLGPGLGKKLSDVNTPQGIIAVAAIPSLPREMGERIIALNSVADPGNMGTILRSAQAFGCQMAILGQGCADPYGPKSMRSGMGAQLHLGICQVEDLSTKLKDLAANGYDVIGMDIRGNESLPKLSHKRVVVIGSEAHGMSTETADACTALYRIAMQGGADSLNAAVAAGIALYQIMAQA